MQSSVIPKPQCNNGRGLQEQKTDNGSENSVDNPEASSDGDILLNINWIPTAYKYNTEENDR